MVAEDIEAAYRDMAADEAREREALDWSEGLVGDSTQAEPHAPRRSVVGELRSLLGRRDSKNHACHYCEQ